MPSDLVTNFVPFETVDLVESLPESYFTVGTVVEVKGPETGRNGKTFLTFKFANLVKYDMSRLRKNVLDKIEEVFDNNQQVMKQAARSFNTDGYKTLRIIVFGEDLCKAVAKKIGIVGLVVCLSNLKRLDYSEHSGVTLRIENEEQVFCVGKSEDLSFCKGAPKGTSVNLLPVMQLGKHLECNRFFNKSQEKACSEHKFMEAEKQMTMIRSGRATLHSDFIDINKVKNNQLKEEKEKQKGSLSSKMFGNSIRNSALAQKAAPTSPQTKLREIKQASKEQQFYEKYI